MSAAPPSRFCRGRGRASADIATTGDDHRSGQAGGRTSAVRGLPHAQRAGSRTCREGVSRSRAGSLRLPAARVRRAYGARCGSGQRRADREQKAGRDHGSGSQERRDPASWVVNGALTVLKSGRHATIDAIYVYAGASALATVAPADQQRHASLSWAVGPAEQNTVRRTGMCPRRRWCSGRWWILWHRRRKPARLAPAAFAVSWSRRAAARPTRVRRARPRAARLRRGGRRGARAGPAWWRPVPSCLDEASSGAALRGGHRPARPPAARHPNGSGRSDPPSSCCAPAACPQSSGPAAAPAASPWRHPAR